MRTLFTVSLVLLGLVGGACVVTAIGFFLSLPARLRDIERELTWISSRLTDHLNQKPAPGMEVCMRCGSVAPEDQMEHTGRKTVFGGELLLCPRCQH